jgi:hypothetical protein
MSATDTPAMPSIVVHWIRSNVLAAIILCVASAAIDGVGYAVGDDGDTESAGIVYMAMIAFPALAGIAYGTLTGAVLVRITPRLPARMWIALQVVLAVVIGKASLVASAAAVGGGRLSEGILLIAGAFIGAVMGALVGGAEALVLRRAASGILMWIGWSMVAHALMMTLFFGGAQLWDTEPGFFMGELIRQVLSFLGSMVSTMVMLLALLRLRDPLLVKGSGYFT